MIRNIRVNKTDNIIVHPVSNPDNDSQVVTKENHIDRLPIDLRFTNWGGVPSAILDHYHGIYWNLGMSLPAGPLATESEQLIAERWQGEIIVFVKSWEPPLRELEDFLKAGRGFVVPLDWKLNSLIPPKEQHINEWNRFVSNVNDWQIFLPHIDSTEQMTDE